VFVYKSCRFVLSMLFFVKMVRNYFRKRSKPEYSEDDLKMALEKIRSRAWTYKEAAEATKIPIGTLAARISRNSSGCVGRPIALHLSEPRSTNPMLDPIGSYRIRWSDEILQDFGRRNHIGFRRTDMQNLWNVTNLTRSL